VTGRAPAPPRAPAPAPVPGPRWRHEVKSWGKSLAVALAIWLFLRSYFIEAFRIPSASMENTLLVGDFLFVDKLSYGGEFQIPIVGVRFLRMKRFADPARNSIVVFRSVEDSTPNLDIVKRVMGIPGDTLQMVHDTVSRNGKALDEPYALHLAATPIPDDPLLTAKMRALQLPHYVGKNPAAYRPTVHNWGPIVVPPGSYWVMGDNRDESYDSRYWGFLPRSHVEGRPLFIYLSVASDPFRIRWNREFKHPS
jgi:signal peptidase I